MRLPFSCKVDSELRVLLLRLRMWKKRVKWRREKKENVLEKDIQLFRSRRAQRWGGANRHLVDVLKKELGNRAEGSSEVLAFKEGGSRSEGARGLVDAEKEEASSERSRRIL